MSKRVSLSVPVNSGLYEILPIKTAQDISAWQFRAYVYDPADPTVAMASIALTIDSDDKTVALMLTPETLTNLLGAATEKSLQYVVLIKPNGLTFGVRARYGILFLFGGGPEWQ